jgi:hypothetical protein
VRIVSERADRLEAQALQLLEEADTSARIEWSLNPCTRALRAYLECDQIRFFEQFSNGAFTGSSVDETAQLTAKALGSVQTLDSIHEWIEDTITGDKDNADSSGTQDLNKA